MSIKEPVKPHHSNRLADQLLRALAICCVVLIHFLAMFHDSPYVARSPYHFWAVSIDQLARVCVPLFVALSGYGLTMKYTHQKFEWGEFVKRRLWKLIPLYLAWSTFDYVMLRIVPSWHPTWQTTTFPEQLLFGQADYQMYFVPMIIQLYLLFPLLLKLMRKFPALVLVIACFIQAYLYRRFETPNLTLGGMLLTDQLQYSFFATWIFYFVLGMYLPTIHRWLGRSKFMAVCLSLVVLVAGVFVCRNALTNIELGYDPIVALRFTRFTVLFYASVAIVLLTWLATKVRALPGFVKKLGDHSYAIYLGHTFFLRVLFSIGILR